MQHTVLSNTTISKDLQGTTGSLRSATQNEVSGEISERSIGLFVVDESQAKFGLLAPGVS